MKDSYTVTERLPKKILACFGLFASIFFPVLLIYFELLDGEISTDSMSSFWLVMLIAIILLVLSIVLLYSSLRPRVKVYGEIIVCYPRLKRKFEIHADDITARIVEPITNLGFLHANIWDGMKVTGSRVMYSPVRAASNKGSMNFSSTKLAEIRFGVKKSIIHYRIGDREIISIHNGMKNALMFDKMIALCINKKNYREQ